MCLFIPSAVVTAQFPDEIYRILEGDTAELTINLLGITSVSLSVDVVAGNGTAGSCYNTIVSLMQYYYYFLKLQTL